MPENVPRKLSGAERRDKAAGHGDTAVFPSAADRIADPV
jgi:hypothetical protein